jgi:hypothetical protein
MAAACCTLRIDLHHHAHNGPRWQAALQQESGPCFSELASLVSTAQAARRHCRSANDWPDYAAVPLTALQPRQLLCLCRGLPMVPSEGRLRQLSEPLCHGDSCHEVSVCCKTAALRCVEQQWCNSAVRVLTRLFVLSNAAAGAFIDGGEAECQSMLTMG